MRNAHQVVIYNVCKVIGRHAVALNQNIVLEFGIVNVNRAVNEVVVRRSALGGNVLPYNERFARVEFSLNFLFGKVKTVLVVFAVAVFVGKRFKAFFRAEEVICSAELD